MKDMVRSASESRELPYGLHYFPEPVTSTVHHFYITGEVGPAYFYTEMIHVIRSASKGDVVYLHLNTTGGQLDTGIQIINAMRESQAHVIASIEAQAFSLGSMIFLAADDYIVHDNSMMMIHNFSSGMAGKGNEQRLRLEAITTMFDEFVRPIYVPFITDVEYEDVIEGKDMWLHASEIKERLDEMVALRNPPEPEEVVAKVPAKRKAPAKKPTAKKVTK